MNRREGQRKALDEQTQTGKSHKAGEGERERERETKEDGESPRKQKEYEKGKNGKGRERQQRRTRAGTKKQEEGLMQRENWKTGKSESQRLYFLSIEIFRAVEATCSDMSFPYALVLGVLQLLISTSGGR